MRDARTSRRVGRAQIARSRLAGFALVAGFGLALGSVGCAQPDAGSPSAASQNHVRLPSLAPVVQAVIPPVVHVSAIQKPSGISVGYENSAGIRRSKHQSADRGLPPAALDELLRRFFSIPDVPIRSTGSGFIVDPAGFTVTGGHVV
jgi:S1-C subfamily serine protease